MSGFQGESQVLGPLLDENDDQPYRTCFFLSDVYSVQIDADGLFCLDEFLYPFETILGMICWVSTNFRFLCVLVDLQNVMMRHL